MADDTETTAVPSGASIPEVLSSLFALPPELSGTIAGSLLSGAQITKGALIHSGISVDQMIAAKVGQDTPQSSIVLACEQPMTGYHETKFRKRQARPPRTTLIPGTG